MHPRTLGLFPSQQFIHRIENSEPHGLAVHVPGFQHLVGPYGDMDMHQGRAAVRHHALLPFMASMASPRGLNYLGFRSGPVGQVNSW
mgnify:CR=1 FL=1